MWKRFQNNPKNLNVGDCVIRAISASTGMDWYTIHKALCDLSAEMADWPNADRVWWAFMEQIGFAKKRLVDRCPDCYTVKQFCADNPQLTGILATGTHVIAVGEGGNYFDTWDSGDEVPIYYWRRED